MILGISTSRLFAYLQLMRPANLFTAMADVLVGCLWLQASWYQTILMLLATTSLYAGGVVLNDCLDAELDRLERPERPIPSGRATKQGAAFLASALLLAGILFAFSCHLLSGMIALIIACMILVYDAFAKRHAWWGPWTMGACRALNLALGMSVLGTVIPEMLFLPVLSWVYVMALTKLSRSEVHGGNNSLVIVVGMIYLAIGLSLLLIMESRSGLIWNGIPILIWAGILTSFMYAAYKHPNAATIRKAVKMSVLCIVLLDASMAAMYVPLWKIIPILVCLPCSVIAAKWFAVT
ncbi:MAG: UbiA-like protein EboC [Cytophagaceae bacterium]|jgi:4-hydroxybenzoate polyprenyltransferase|nr:UbiA-like protein EboC [Cytophagaceae bacterium]